MQYAAEQGLFDGGTLRDLANSGVQQGSPEWEAARDQIIVKAAEHKQAQVDKFNARHAAAKERIGLRAEARSLIGDRALDAAAKAAAKGDRIGGAQAAREIRGLQQTVGPAIEKYGADALKAIKDPKTIKDPERRTEILGALGLGPGGISDPASGQGVMARVNQMTSTPRPTGGGRKAEQLRWDAAQSAKGVLRQGAAVGLDVDNSPAAKQYFSALEKLGSGTGKADLSELAPLKKAFEDEIASSFQARISQADYEKSISTIKKVNMGIAADQARILYYNTKGTAAGLTPNQAMDTIKTYVEDNGEKALQGILNTVKDQKTLDALSANEKLVYGSYLLASQGLGINPTSKKEK